MKPEENQESGDPEIQLFDSLLKKIFRESTKSKSQNTLGQTEVVSKDTTNDQPSKQPNQPEVLSIGDNFGPYKIMGLLGYGGYGTVYRALHTERNSEVALKIPRILAASSKNITKRFVREVGLTQRLNHPNIVPVVDSGYCEGVFFIATQYQKGSDLAVWHENNPDQISESLVIDWGMQLADALCQSYEKGIVHRDLKPRNIIITSSRETDQGKEDPEKPDCKLIPRITDFGLAYSTLDQESESSVSGMILGTIGYMAPEQVLSGHSKVDIRADIYAVGIILAELLMPESVNKFDNLIDYIVHLNKDDEVNDLKKLRKRVDPYLFAVLRKCCETDPDKRYQTPRELFHDFERLKLGLPVSVNRRDSRISIRRVIRRNPVKAVSFLLTICFMMLFMVSLIINQGRISRINLSLVNANNQLKSTLNKLSSTEHEVAKMACNSAIRLAFMEQKENRLEEVHDILDSIIQLESDSGGMILRDKAWTYLQNISGNQFQSHKIVNFHRYLSRNEADQYTKAWSDYSAMRKKLDIMLGAPSFYKDCTSISQVQQSFAYDGSFRGVYHSRYDASEIYYYRDGKILNISKYVNSESVLYAMVQDKIYTFLKAGMELATDDKIKTLKLNDQTVELITMPHLINPSISQDGKWIAGLRKTNSNDRLELIIYDLVLSRKRSVTVAVPKVYSSQNHYPRVVMSPQAKYAVIYYHRGDHLIVLRTSDLKTIHETSWKSDEETDLLNLVSIDEEKKIVLAGSFNGTVKAWGIDGNTSSFAFPKKLQPLAALGFFPDHRVYITVSYLDRIWIWDYDRQQREYERWDHGKEVWSLTYDHTGNTLISCGDDHKIKVWDTRKGTYRLLHESESLVTCGKYSPDLRYFAACDFSGNIKIWKTESWELIRDEKCSQERLRSLEWVPDSQSLFIVGNGKEIIEINIHDKNATRRYPVSSVCNDIVYINNENSFYISEQTDDPRVLEFSYEKREIVNTIGVEKRPTRMAYHPVLNVLVVGYHEGGFGVLSLASKKIVKEVGTRSGSESIWALCFSKDGRNLFTSGSDNRISIYETSHWEALGMMTEHTEKVHSMALSPDGNRLATGDMAGEIIVYDMNDRQ